MNELQSMKEHKHEPDKRMEISGSITCEDCHMSIHNGFDGGIFDYTQNFKDFIKKHYDHDVWMHSDFAPSLPDEFKKRVLNSKVKEMPI